MVALRQVLDGDSQFMRLEEAEKAASEAVGGVIEYIMPALFVGHRLGFKGEELAIAALGRMVGWIAHAMEQFHQDELIRPRASYVGPLPT
jgi:citrate synthase